MSNDTTEAARLHMEAEEPAGRAHVEHPFAREIEAAEVVVDRRAQVPRVSHRAVARQIGDVVERALVEAVHLLGRLV
jgi:hypothetical protein